MTLEWRKDLNSEEITVSTFKLCGYWEGNESIFASMAWVDCAFAEKMTGGKPNPDGQILGQHMAQVTLVSDRHIEKTMEGILEDTGCTDLEYSVNLAYTGEINEMAAQESAPMYLGMILVFVAGYLIIYNIFQISVAADIQFYGRLKTLGMSTKQIRHLIYGQANRLCVIGIPVGLLSGFLLGMVLVPAFVGIVEGNTTVSANPFIFVGSAMFAWITVLISCLHPTRLAGKVSPMEALRYSDGDSGKKKIKKSKKGASLSAMAWANLGRNKKRTITVICSLTLGLVLLSIFYAKNASFDMEKYLAELTIADFELADATSEDFLHGYDPKGTTLNDDLIAQVEQLEGVEALGHLYSHQFVWNMEEQTVLNFKEFYTEDVLKDWESYNSEEPEKIRKAIKDKQMNAVIFGLDGIPLNAITQKQYILSGTYDEEQFASGDYILAVGPAIESSDVEEYKALPTPSIGENIAIEGKTYTLMAVVRPLSPVDAGAMESGTGNEISMEFILPSSSFQKQWRENTLRKLFVNVADEHLSSAQKMLDDYTENADRSLPVTSRSTMAEQYQKETRSSAVMGNVISIVIALVGVLNFINSMITAIISRKKEFAMIQSVGMTKRQLCTMLMYEGLDYALITLAVSFVISILSVGIGVRAMVEGGYSTFHFTLLPLCICTPCILIFAVIIPYLCFKNLEKKSIVERLRAID